MEDDTLLSAVKGHARAITDPSGQEVLVLDERSAMNLAQSFGVHLGEVFKEALRQDILPYRYIRNKGLISAQDQLRLAESCVAVVGLGGLGGQVILLLARMGVGRLVAIDGDRFDETNLNRQALSKLDNIGSPKALEAAEAVKEINPAIEVYAHHITLQAANTAKLLQGTDVIVDALDNVMDRFLLEKSAKELAIPMVHGGIGGFEGQVMTIYPEDEGLEVVYGPKEKWERFGDSKQGVEVVLGVPAVTACLVAALEVMEVLKILLHRGRVMKDRLLRLDLEMSQFHEILFKEA